jgi:hypothetical protein
LDQDYIDQLSDKDKEWLSQFNEEYMAGSSRHKGKKLNKTKKERRESYARNNARNRDLYALGRTRGWVTDVADHIENNQVINPAAQENAVIDLIDIKDGLDNSE